MGSDCSTCHKYSLFTQDCLECKRTFCDKCQPFVPCSECRLKLNLTPTCPSCQTPRSQVHLWPCQKCHQYTMCSNCHDRHKNICLACAHMSEIKCYCGAAICEQCGIKCVDCPQIIDLKCLRNCCGQSRCLNCDYKHQLCACGIVTNVGGCDICGKHTCFRCNIKFVCDCSGWQSTQLIKCSAKRNVCHQCFNSCECPDRKFYCEHHQRKCAVCEKRTLGSHIKTVEYQCELCNLPWKIKTCCHHTPEEHLQMTDLWQSPTGNIRCPKHRGTCQWHPESPTILPEPCFTCFETSNYIENYLEVLPLSLRRIITGY